MRPARGGGGMGGMFLPTRTWATRLAIGIIAVSVVAGLFRSSFGPLLLLMPAAVVKGFIFEPFTYSFIDQQPMGVLFGALCMWQMGSSLELSWGSRRFLLFCLFVPALAGALTTAMYFVVPMPVPAWDGAWVMAGSCWAAYGWAMGRRETNFWGMPLSGNMFAGIGILFIVVEAALSHWSMVVPRAFALALTFLYVRYGSPSIWFTRMRAGQLQRQLKRRAKHLNVVSDDRNIGGGSDNFLH